LKESLTATKFDADASANSATSAHALAASRNTDRLIVAGGFKEYLPGR
jgi:hypothetical protein